MKKKYPPTRPIADELSAKELDQYLKNIGALLKVKRKERTSLESFAYEINFSRSAMTRYEGGGDMYLSTFLKLLHGLDIPVEQFFKELK